MRLSWLRARENTGFMTKPERKTKRLSRSR